MTDLPIPNPTPSLGNKAVHNEGRAEALRRLAVQSGPSGPTGDASVLTDRVLLHSSWDIVDGLLPSLPEAIGGLVLRGTKARLGARKLRERGYTKPLLTDPEGYAVAVATEESPFVVDPEGRDALFQLSLDEVLQQQRDCGASAALTPTGYLLAGDSDALRGAVSAADKIARTDVIFSVPIDVAWLTDDHVGNLIAVLRRLEKPKAVFIGGQFDPMKRYKHAVANLRRVLAEAGNVAVFRTDLTGFDAMSHGAFSTSIGSGGSLRHMTPFGQIRRAGKQDPSPSVLFGDLMSFYKGSTLQSRFANNRPPTCRCHSCQGRALDTFLGRDDQMSAHRHSLCVWSNWVSSLFSHATLGGRAAWWRNLCTGAVDYAEVLNTQIRQPEAFSAPKPLRAWAELPAWASVVESESSGGVSRER